MLLLLPVSKTNRLLNGVRNPGTMYFPFIDLHSAASDQYEINMGAARKKRFLQI